MKKEIRDKIGEILSNRLGIDIGEINDELKLKEDLGIDSFDLLRMIFDVEDVFGISVPPDGGEDIKTVGDIHSYIYRRLSERDG
ncbi:MAG: acyl carrier protein [Nitrospirae bacterium]|nr:acyl carrier protein [Nitrospirota bacterium]